MKRIFRLLTVISIAFMMASCFGDISKCNHNKNEQAADDMNYETYIKNFWNENKNTLEDAAADMRSLGIIYFYNGSAYRAAGVPYDKTDYTDSISTILHEMNRGTIEQFGWSFQPQPLFSQGNNYFYCTTPMFHKGENLISLKLVYTDNSENEIPFDYYPEKLSSNWYLVTNSYGE